MAAKYRAEQVGSFLRPKEVLEAHQAQAQGTMSAEQVKQIEDKAILDILAMQKQVGIDVLSDGEFRRPGWASGFQAAVDGYVPGQPAVSIRINVPDGGPAPQPGVGQGQGSQAGFGGPRVIGEKLRPKRRIVEHETSFLKQHADGRPFKGTMPAVSYVVSRSYNPEITGKAYPTRFDVLKDAAGIVNGEIKTLVSEGVPYVQLDNPHYTDYLEAALRDRWEAIGVDQKKALGEDIEADNLCFRGVDRSNVILAMHLCRGNAGRGPEMAAGWHKSGGYDWVAEQLFSQLEVDTFLLEYDDERSGGFEPLRFMPKGKTAVLGLITTKKRDMETADQVMRRIDEAAKYMATEDMALSPQCGFASTQAGNPLTPDEQKRKLELVVEVARRVWPNR
jgi:5-methyltetrahydropteroyltriglutamate--homocysteine methyltransferase